MKRTVLSRWTANLNPLAPLVGDAPAPAEPEIVFPPSFYGTRGRRSPWVRISAWLGGLGGFYAVSSLFHLLGVGLIAAAPMYFTPNLQTQAKRALAKTKVNNIIDPLNESVCFDFVEPPAQRRIRQNDKIAEAIAAELGVPQNGLAAKSESTSESTEKVSPPPASSSADEKSIVPAAEAALAIALSWIVRHQSPDGSWSLHDFSRQCRGGSCGGAGTVRCEAAATGLALLPLVTAAESSRSAADVYEESIARGVTWLLAQQRPDGDLSALGDQRMYSHAVAGLALARRYAQTRDPRLAAAVQLALDFSLSTQNPTTGGWDYEPGGSGNTFSVALQLQLAEAASGCGIALDRQCCRLADRWFRSVEQASSKGLFAYEPQRPVSPAMTAVGLGYLRLRGVPPDHQAVRNGHAYLLANPPDAVFARDATYWSLATPVVKGFGDLEWKSWWERLARGVIDTQATADCAAGSWSVPTDGLDEWSASAGRLYLTSVAAQLLQSNSGDGPSLVSPGAAPQAARAPASTASSSAGSAPATEQSAGRASPRASASEASASVASEPTVIK